MDEELAKYGCLEDNLHYCRAIKWILPIVPVTMLVFGLSGNMVSFAVLSRKTLRKKSSFLYLRYICIFDCTFLTMALTRMMTLAYFKVDMNAYSSPFCRPITMVGLSSQAVSMYMIALMCMERVIFIWFPLKAREIVTKRRTITAILSIITCVITFESVLIFGLKSGNQGTNATWFSTQPQCIEVANEGFHWHLTAAMVNTGMPIVCVVICNGILVKKLLARSMAVATLSESFSRSAARNAGTKIAIVITTFYFVTAIPYYGTRLFFIQPQTIDENFARTRLIGLLLDLWSFGNYSCNFLLYFWTGTYFRTEFWALLREVARFCCPFRGR